MMGFREIKTKERLTEKDQKNDKSYKNFKQIKSQTGMTIDEAIQFMGDLFR